MANYLYQAAFSAGEISPSLWSRTDVAKYTTGAAILRNWFIDYHGGASNRAGTQFIGQCLATGGPHTNQPRLISFVVSTIAAYVLEFGDHYVRFVSNGQYVIDSGTGLPLVVATPYAWQDLPTLKFSQSANVLTLTHPSYYPQELRRLTSTTFALTPQPVGPNITAPGGVVVTRKNGTGDTLLYGYVITTVGADGNESLPSIPKMVTNDLLNQNTGVNNTVAWTGVVGASFYRIYKIGPLASGVGNTASPPTTIYGFIGQATATNFTDNNIAPDFATTPPMYQDPWSAGQVAEIAITSAGSGYVQYIIPLVFSGDGTGAEGYGIVDITTGSVVGVVLTQSGSGYTTISVTDSAANTATYSATLGQQSGSYPAAVGFFQQRKVEGGTANFPEAMVFSRPGAYNNWDTSPISRATDSITASLASREVNAIKAFVPMNTGLIVLTTGSGFLVSGGSPDAPLTPESISALPQASSGANDLPPIVINYDILYGQNRGAVVRDLAFNFYVQSYTGTDRSLWASHLFNNYALTEWAYSEEPFRLVQAVRNDGTLLNFTYVPEQEIFAWSSTVTDGYFRSIASIPEGNVNATYVVVQRLINGAYVYYVERFDSRQFTEVANAWFLDSALSLPGTFPAANGSISNFTGDGSKGSIITLFALPGPFAPGDVDKTLWFGGGHANIVAYVDATTVRAEVLVPFPLALGSTSYAPWLDGEWEMNSNITHISNLNHLEGATVSALVDGVPVSGLVVQSGQITLPSAGSKVLVGLPYTAQLQTLRLDAQSAETVQGRRKQISGITATVNLSSGLSVGPDFTHLTPMKELISPFPARLYTGFALTTLRSVWDKNGQTCFEQTLPLPATILGLITEATLGDTER